MSTVCHVVKCDECGILIDATQDNYWVQDDRELCFDCLEPFDENENEDIK